MNELLGCFALMLSLAAVIIPIVAIVTTLSNKKKIAVLEQAVASLQAQVNVLRNHVRTAAAPSPEPASDFAPQPEAAPTPAATSPVEEPPLAAPVIPPTPVALEVARATQEVPLPEPAAETAVPPQEPVDLPEEAAAFEAIPEPPPPPPPAAPAKPPKAPRPPFDWENLVGVKLFSWISGIALALGAIYFLKYTIDHGWLRPTIRAMIGTVSGIGLLALCELRIAHRYRTTANAMDGAGIAILYSTFFACHSLWHILSATAVFGLLLLVTACAVGLSIRRDSIFIAVLGLLGGFLTPYMLSTGEDRPFGLFGYLLLLNVGLAWVAYRKRWPALTGLSLVFTTLYQWGWAMKFLNSSKFPVAVVIFLLFALMSMAALFLGSKRGERDQRFEKLGLASTALPLLFAVYAAAIPAYGNRFWLLFGFLFILDVAVLILAVARQAGWLHVIGAATTLLSFAIWCSVSYQPNAWPEITGIVAAFVLLYAGTPALLTKIGRSAPSKLDIATYAAPLLLFTFPFFAGTEARAASPGILFGVLFVLVAVCAWSAMRSLQGMLYYLAALAAIAAEGVWSSEHLTADRILQALAVYGGFAILFVGVPMVARRMSIALRPEGASSFLLLISVAMLFFLAGGPIAEASLWGMALLLVTINAALFAESALSRHPVAAIFGVILSWVVIATWWSSVTVLAFLIPALAVTAGFAVLVAAGFVWSSKNSTATAETQNGLYLALAVHLFLLFLATQPQLTANPWPLLAVLAVVDLAIGVAGLYMRIAPPFTLSLIASQAVLALWAGTSDKSPAPTIATFAALAVAAMGCLWMLFGERLGERGVSMLQSAVAALFGALVVVLVASGDSGHPSLAIELLGWGLTVAAILFLSARSRRAGIANAASVAVTFALVLWKLASETGGFTAELALFTLLYALFLAWPFFAQKRIGSTVALYQPMVIASAAYLVLMRNSMLEAHYGNIIGVLPIAQSVAVTALLVFAIRRREQPANPADATLALVAGTALALVTVAIPLQLDKEWITIGWALETAALMWLYRRIPHRGLLYTATALGSVVFVRLTFNSSVFDYHARGDLRIWNWYLYAYLTSAAALFLASWIASKTNDSIKQLAGARVRSILGSMGAILLFLLVNIEVADYFSVGPSLTFNFSASLAQDMTYTLAWAIFAIALLITGLLLKNRPTRIASLALLLVTILKCFIHDLGRLGGLYRVVSLVGLAISVAIVALLIQRFVLQPPNRSTPSTP